MNSVTQSPKTSAPTYLMDWLDPITGSCFAAGTAEYQKDTGEFLLNVHEEPEENSLYLRPVDGYEDGLFYFVEVKTSQNGYSNKEVVGEGFYNPKTGGDIHIHYGSKFKKLVVRLSEKEKRDYA